MSRKRYEVEVTQENINLGIVRDSGHCVIAEAVRATIPGASRISVDLQTIRWSVLEVRKRYIALTPARAQDALIALDQENREALRPFKFRLEASQVINIKDRTGETPVGPKTLSTGHRERKGAVPIVEGGHAPPIAALSNSRGRIRRFGLRQLKP